MEVEIKLAVADSGELEERLRELGYRVIRARCFESNTIFDLPDGTLRARGELIRLREADGTCIFTYKGPPKVARHKEREELETAVGDVGTMRLILERLGYVARFRYEKFRAEWGKPDEEGVVMLDETPVGVYVELEGPGEWIDRLARELGYGEGDYISLSYARLYAADCAAKGLQVNDMVFSGGGTSTQE